MIPLSGLLSITIIFILLELLFGFAGFYLLFIGFGFFGASVVSTIAEMTGVVIPWHIQILLAAVFAAILIFTKFGEIIKNSLIKTKKSNLKDENVFDGTTKGTIHNKMISAHGTFWKHEKALNLSEGTQVQITIKNGEVVEVVEI